MLSVIAQQILCIQRAVIAHVKTFVFEGTSLSLNPSCFVCVTNNELNYTSFVIFPCFLHFFDAFKVQASLNCFPPFFIKPLLYVLRKHRTLARFPSVFAHSAAERNWSTHSHSEKIIMALAAGWFRGVAKELHACQSRLRNSQVCVQFMCSRQEDESCVGSGVMADIVCVLT